MRYVPKIIRLNGKKRLRPNAILAEKGDFSNKKRPKRDPKIGLGLLRDPGFPKRDPVGSRVVLTRTHGIDQD